MQTEQPSFHPEQLIPLVHAQHPERRDLIRALQLCNTGQWENTEYISFVKDTVNTSSLREQLTIEAEDKQRMVLDILPDGRIARIHFNAST